MNNKKIGADNLWVRANTIQDNYETEENVRTINVTKLLLKELELRIKNGEQINININGIVRSGKSTAAQELCVYIKTLIKKHHKLNRPMKITNILRDQNEYARTVKKRPESFKHECDVIDEWAELETTGYNSTIETKFLKQFSDQQAARYYHRIACSPTDTIDENADISLESVPGTRKQGKSMFLLRYRLRRGDHIQTILLGHVIIDVTKILKAKWYKEYLRRKAAKWELVNKHNIKSARDLEYAEIILNVYNRTKRMSQAGLTNKKHFKIIFQQEADKAGIWFSILGDRDILETIEGLSEIEHEIGRLEIKKEIIKGKIKKQPEKTELRELLGDLKEAQKEFTKIRGELLGRQLKLKQLWEEYQRIDEEKRL